MAALAALYYGQMYPGKVSYVGFGTPRVGNGEFVKLFNSVIKNPVRVANGRDPGAFQKICLLPFFTYTH